MKENNLGLKLTERFNFTCTTVKTAEEREKEPEEKKKATVDLDSDIQEDIKDKVLLDVGDSDKR